MPRTRAAHLHSRLHAVHAQRAHMQAPRQPPVYSAPLDRTTKIATQALRALHVYQGHTPRSRHMGWTVASAVQQAITTTTPTLRRHATAALPGVRLALPLRLRALPVCPVLLAHLTTTVRRTQHVVHAKQDDMPPLDGRHAQPVQLEQPMKIPTPRLLARIVLRGSTAAPIRPTAPTAQQERPI